MNRNTSRPRPELLDLAMPQLRGTEEPFRPQLAERPQTRTAALLEDGRPVLLHLDLGPRESYDVWLSFYRSSVTQVFQARRTLPR